MRFASIHLIILIIILFVGCSGVSNPTSPKDNSTDPAKLNFSNLPVGVSEWFPDGSVAGGSGILGVYSLDIDKQNVSAELTPLRQSSLTDVLECVDITNFLTLSPCTDCARIKSISLSPESYLILNIGIKHPFPAGNPLKPITGRNRADLHVFNIEGQVISNASSILFPGLGKSIADMSLVNADGYSSYLDPSLDEIFPTEATIHPYILHFDDYTTGNFNPLFPTGFETVTDPPPSGNLVMAMGCDYDFQDYVFNISGKKDLFFAVGCTYGVSAASMSLRFSPEYRVPQHNKKAASEVGVNIISNELKENDGASSALLQIEVLDISHGVSVGTSLDQMLSDSSVGSISAEIPGVTATPVVNASPVPTGGNGRDSSDPLKYEITVTNNALGVAGTYSGLVKVLDTYSPGQNTSPLLMGMDGIKRVAPIQNPLEGLFQINEFATYATFSIDVAPDIPNEPPIPVISSPCDNIMVLIGTRLFFDGRVSWDNTGYIVGYAWDFDWDEVPANFTVDSTLDHLHRQFDNPNIYTVGLRVEDSEGEFGYRSITVNAVVEFVPPMWHQPALVASWSGVEASERDDNPSRQVAVDCEGLVHIIFKYRPQSGTGAGLYYANYDRFNMSTPVHLDGSTDTLYQPTLRIDYQGNLHLVYYFNNSIRYMKRESGTWSIPENVITSAQTPGYQIEHPSMDLNYRGDIMVTFPKVDTSPNWFLAYVLNEGSGWSAHQNITPFYSSPYSTTQMVNADPDSGGFHLLYKGHPDSTSSALNLFHVIYKDGSWNTPFRFNSDTGVNIALSGFVSTDGDVFAVWQTDRFGATDAMYQRYDAVTERWGDAIRVSRNPLSADYSYIPDITVDANGFVMYVWEYDDGSTRRLLYKRFFESDSSTTIFNNPEMNVVTGAWNKNHPCIFFEQNGMIHCVYEDDRSNPGNYWANDMYYVVWK